MDKKVNKICFARIHKKTTTQELDSRKIIEQVVVKNNKRMDSIEKAIECIDELNNLILSHKIQLLHIRNNPKLKKS
jgi:hypothetical protein